MKLNRLSKYFHTARYLRWEQFYFRAYKAFCPIRLNIGKSLARRHWTHHWNAPVYKTQSLFENQKCSFLNHESVIDKASSWNDSSQDKLWLYNLHYFDDLDSLGAENRVELAISWILQWINQNPPASGNGWEPYPTSLRIVNWVKWLSKNTCSSPVIDESLALQARVLEQKLEYHLLANHLFVNAQALIFAGCWLSSKDADRWLKKGIRLFVREVKEQFLPDGAHFELSPMYHANLLLNVLDVINLAYCSQNNFLLSKVEQLKAVVKKGIGWLELMMHPDDRISFFNDAAFSNAPELALIKEYAALLAIDVPAIFKEPNELSYVHMPDSGYIRFQSDTAVAILDVGCVGPDYQPGHAHADTLSFELSVGKQRVFVNTGTSQYGLGVERDWQRSTSAHNTVAINNLNSSEIWGGFRVARRARPFDLNIVQEPQAIHVACSHNGYMRLKNKIVHRREWLFSNNKLKIDDKVNAPTCIATAFFHLHPDLQIEQLNNKSLQIVSDKVKVKMTFSDSEICLEEGYWCPEFGVKINNKLVKVNFSSHLETNIEWY
ncbi:heparinase II/III family protein [Legionella dresdenensis]|uniref:Heparinase II/III family protein n=1 Tax=Legionella dresdenensis TaxID=450200 RepID=A0ABV8CCE4_9GAMM